MKTTLRRAMQSLFGGTRADTPSGKRWNADTGPFVRAALWLGVILLFVSRDDASYAAAPKEKFTAPCPNLECAKTVVFTPSRITINGSATVTNGVRTDRTLHFKCPACRKKTSVPNSVLKAATVPAVAYPRLPPMPPGLTNKTMSKAVKPKATASAALVPAVVVGAVSITYQVFPASPPFPAQTNVVVSAQHLAGHECFVEASADMVTWFTGRHYSCSPTTHFIRADFAIQRRGQFFRSRNEKCPQ